jgi:hypothetical protein
MLSLQSLGYIIVEDDLKNMPERFKIKKWINKTKKILKRLR